MTTPHQAAPTDIAQLVGMGAFQVGNAAQNWGQQVTDTFVRVLINGPAASLGAAFTSLEHFLEEFGRYLSTLPLEALKMFQAFIPGAVSSAFNTVSSAVSTILNALSLGNLRMLLSDFQNWVSSVYNILAAELHQILDIIMEYIVTPITGRVAGFMDWFNNLRSFQTGTTNAVGGLADGIANLISGLNTTSGTIDEAVNGAIGQFGSFLNQIQQGVTGAINAGQQTTATVVQGALDGARQNITNIQNQIAALFGMVPKKTTAIGASHVDDVSTTTTVSSNDWGSKWTILGATGTTHLDGEKLVWDDSGAAARYVLGRYNDPTLGTYQTVRFTLATLQEQPLSGGNPCSNMLIANATLDFSEFVYAEFFWNRIDIGYYNGGVEGWDNRSNYHVLASHNTSTGGAWPLGAWSLKCGTETSPYQYIISFGPGDGAQQLSYTDTAMNVPADSSHRYAGQALFSTSRGSGESTPGSVSLWRVDDTNPTAMIGSGMRAYRTSTTPVTMNSTTAGSIVPGSFYDNLEYCSADMHWDAATSTLTVDEPGMYLATVCLGFTQRYYNCMTQPLLFRNGSLYLSGDSREVMGTYSSGTSAAQVPQRGVWFTFPVRIINPGDTIAPGLWSQNLAGTPAPVAVNVGGESTGTVSWFSVSKINP